MEFIVVVLVIVAFIGILRVAYPSSPQAINADTTWYNASQNEFTITTAEQLAGLAELVNKGNNFKSKVVKLGQDIKLNNTKNYSNWKDKPPINIWKPIGCEIEVEESEEIPELEVKENGKIKKIQHVILVGKSRKKIYFNGIFDGNNFAISGVYIDNSENYQGLFGCVGTDGIILKLKVVASYINAGEYVGGIVGYNNGLINNCYSDNKISGQKNVGGLIGENDGKIDASYSTSSVVGIANIGGLAGINQTKGKINNCYSIGTASAILGLFGGLVGSNEGYISYSYYSGNIQSAGSYGGGLAGTNSGKINNCYSTGAVRAGSNIGGLVGINANSIINSYSTSLVLGDLSVGGLVGHNEGNIGLSYSTGSVMGMKGVIGGLVGGNCNGLISDSYSFSEVSGGINTGGLLGSNGNKGVVINCYSVGIVKGDDHIGGAIGYNGDVGEEDKERIIVNCYYNSQTSKQKDKDKGDGITTEEMKDEFSYDEWDFDETWAIDEKINDGYPYLRNNPPKQQTDKG